MNLDGVDGHLVVRIIIYKEPFPYTCPTTVLDLIFPKTFHLYIFTYGRPLREVGVTVGLPLAI